MERVLKSDSLKISAKDLIFGVLHYCLLFAALPGTWERTAVRIGMVTHVRRKTPCAIARTRHGIKGGELP